MNKEENHKDYYRKEEYLPKKLIRELTTLFNSISNDYRTKNNFLKCVGIIYHKQVNDFYGLQNYVATGRSYWKTIFGGDYHSKVLQPLLELGIIECHDFGYRSFTDKNATTSKGKTKGLVGKRYRINPNLTDDNCEVIPYLGNGKASSAEETIYNNGKPFSIESISDKNFLVGINTDKVSQWVAANSDNICHEYLHREYIDSLPDKLVIEYHEYISGGSYNSKYASVEAAKFIAITRGKELFYFKNKFYIADIQEFLNHRIPNLRYHYNREISKVGTLDVIDKRSMVTLRLHNYLVNFPSKLLQFITINNQSVVQIDLQTSQFLIFANLLNIYINNGEKHLLTIFKHKKTKTYLKRLFKVLEAHKQLLPNVGIDIADSNSCMYSNSDVLKFIRDVFFTDFYVVVQRELGLPQRGIAKMLLFKLLFKKTNNRDALLDKLAINYPIVMSIIADFKKPDENVSNDKSHENNFSVFLQCIESEIFIDNILKPLRTEGIPCFTRHDSVVVASGYEDQVEELITEVFARFGFRYNHKIEDMFWETVDSLELEDSGYIDWLADESELTTDFIIEPSGVADENHAEEIYDIDEQQLLTIKRLLDIKSLMKIEYPESYYDYVDIEFLEDILKLPLLPDDRNTLYDDINNLRDGMSFLQTKTDNLLGTLVSRFERIELSNEE